PAGTIIEPNGHLVICRVLDEFQATFGDQITALGNFSGLLRNSGERVTLSNRTGETVDSVKYADRSPWPVGADGYSASLERICPTAPGDALNWAPAPLPNDGRRPTGTPGQQNATYSKNLPLAISEVTFQPTNPKANESITVHAKVSGKGKVALLYRVAKSGHVGDEIELPMQIETTGKKSVHYKGVIPAQPSRSIVRFRIRSNSTNGGKKNRAVKAAPVSATDHPDHRQRSVVEEGREGKPGADSVSIAPPRNRCHPHAESRRSSTSRRIPAHIRFSIM
ncbi:MAG: hypothetical protein IH991_17510, partial [Planctomycetes bacterium]|nr:hypothetical protein [Planctomycetota bacterium]